MTPRKDYDDYAKFINDAYTEEKSNILNKTMSAWTRTTSTTKERPANPLNLLTPIQVHEIEDVRSSTKNKFNRTFSTMN